MKDTDLENLGPNGPKLSEIIDVLKSQFMSLADVVYAIKSTGLSPGLNPAIAEVVGLLQRYSDEIGDGSLERDRQATPQVPVVHTANSTPKAEDKKKKTRRKRSKSYDLLLLEALMQRNRYGYPVGQQTLFELAAHLDTTSKKGSLVSKLNRWRNDKQWVEWSDPEDVCLTDNGEKKRDRLLTLVQREGSIELIKETLQAVWKIDIEFQLPLATDA